jgi:plasmid stabilization system protein ParE
MAKEVIWAFRAVQDRDGIYRFWEHHNQSDSYSKKLDLLFQEAVRLISQFPALGPLTAFPGVRVKIVRTFKIFYRVNSETIEIVRVWDSHQNPDTLKIF